MSEIKTIVLDNGTGFCKIGFAGADQPYLIGRTAVGHSVQTKKTDPMKYYVGGELEAEKPIVNLNYPIDRGIITNWDDMQRVWEYLLLKELHVDTSHHPLLITEPPFNPKSNREGIAEIMYELFKIPALHIATPSVLTLYALARTSALVVDSGEGVTTVVPVQDGYALTHAIKRQNIAGRDLTNHMRELLLKRGVEFTANDKTEIVREIKETMCYVKPWACDINRCSALTASYVLPDGKEIQMGFERFQCAEAMFNPSIMGMEADGVQDLVHSSIIKCDTDIRRNLFGNILLTGGTTMLPGFETRIQRDVSNMAPQNVIVNAFPSLDRPASAWIGGSILASLSIFGRMCIKKREYEECGPNILHQHF